MNLKYEVGQSVAIEVPKTITETVTEIISAEIKSITICASGAKYLTSKGAFTEEQLDSYAQPAREEPAQTKEPIKLYCVKDDPYWLTKGNIYTFDGKITFDSGATGDSYQKYADFKRYNPGLSSCLIPLVSRPAKVGEWVYMVRCEPIWGDWKKGEIYQVAELYSYVGVRISKPSAVYVNHDEYLVLDGYKPGPEYYNGKVVCVDNGGAQYFEVGKAYQFVGGRVFGANGFYSSKYETLEKANCGIGAKFIEFKGE